MRSSLIVCIGNDLVADDAVGHAIHKVLADTPLPDGTVLKFLGLGGMDLLEVIDGEDLLVVVDAVQLGGSVGTVHLLSWDQLPSMEPRPVSGHGIGVKEAIEVARRLYPERVPGAIRLVGVEGICFNKVGQPLTAEVQQAVPKAVETILRLVAESSSAV